MLGDLLGPSARIHDLLQRSMVERLVAEHATGADRSARLWLLVTLEVWLRQLAAPAARPANVRDVRPIGASGTVGGSVTGTAEGAA